MIPRCDWLILVGMKRSCIVVLAACLVLVITPTLLAADAPPLERVDLQGNPLTVVSPPAPEPGLLNATTDAKAALILRPTSLPSPKGTFVVCPGGAYHFLALGGEGLIVADFLNAQGWDAVVLEYTHGGDKSVSGDQVRTRALRDALAAFSLLRQSAEKLHLHTAKLGMMGFSAGGHLTAHTVHELGAANQLSKEILIYPAYLDAPGGINADVQPPAGIKTQLFVAIGGKDAPAWIASSKVYADAAKANGQDAEYHFLPGIPHAFDMKPGDPATTGAFLQNLAAFLAK